MSKAFKFSRSHSFAQPYRFRFINNQSKGKTFLPTSKRLKKLKNDTFLLLLSAEVSVDDSQLEAFSVKESNVKRGEEEKAKINQPILARKWRESKHINYSIESDLLFRTLTLRWINYWTQCRFEADFARLPDTRSYLSLHNWWRSSIDAICLPAQASGRSSRVKSKKWRKCKHTARRMIIHSVNGH